MSQKSSHAKFLAWTLISFLAYGYVGYFLDRSEFPLMIFLFAVLFMASYGLIHSKKPLSLSKAFALGMGFRLLFLFSIPALSDDYFRFIWDGQLLNLGLNPFDELPLAVEASFPNKAELLEKMNSQNYYTIYPPFAQLVYYLGVFFTPNSILGSLAIMRVFILLAEAVSIWYLPKILIRLNLNPLNSLWYALNPLVIVELTGNLHMEAFLIAFLCLSFYALMNNKLVHGVFYWALAATAKLIPLILLPMLFHNFKWKKVTWIYILVGLAFVLSWLPLYSVDLIPHFWSSFQLYFQSFEFNGSLYYLLSYIGELLLGYNPIQTLGALLPKISLVAILWLLLRKKNMAWPFAMKSALFALCVYFGFASIVHPWYVSTVLFFGILSGYSFPILWSFTVLLSYSAYQSQEYTEYPFLIFVEYFLVLLFLLLELNTKGKSITLYPKLKA